jgi:hypothetical protein
MGMYTKINIISKLKSNVNKEMVEKLIEENHLTCRSYYFTGTQNTKYSEEENVLHIDCDLKNYSTSCDSYNPLETLLKFLEEYSGEDYNTFLGYSRYEEMNNPTLYFINKGKISEFQNQNVKENY